MPDACRPIGVLVVPALQSAASMLYKYLTRTERSFYSSLGSVLRSQRLAPLQGLLSKKGTIGNGMISRPFSQEVRLLYAQGHGDGSIAISQYASPAISACTDVPGAGHTSCRPRCLLRKTRIRLSTVARRVAEAACPLVADIGQSGQPRTDCGGAQGCFRY